ncbi:hypothetical protein Bbelb_425650 [Branchiostoma belcheri]|nr:hypothetical protein Bbelb_425650 [Branchiostoma belcheri]
MNYPCALGNCLAIQGRNCTSIEPTIYRTINLDELISIQVTRQSPGFDYGDLAIYLPLIGPVNWRYIGWCSGEGSESVTGTSHVCYSQSKDVRLRNGIIQDDPTVSSATL